MCITIDDYLKGNLHILYKFDHQCIKNAEDLNIKISIRILVDFCRKLNMTPENTNPSSEEELPNTVRRTATIEYIDAKILENLIGVFGNSLSSVINYVIKEWIKSNSNMITTTYGIDIAGIRREYQVTKKGIEIDEMIQNRLFEDLPIRFKRMKRYNTEKLAALLNVHPQTLIDFITLKGDELEERGLNLLIDGEYLIKD